MSLSNSSKVWLIDPTVNNTSRCEFRIPDAHLLSSMKLIDVGVHNNIGAYATNFPATGQYYPSILGVLACIRKLTLYSDSVVLDETQELPSLAAIQHLRNTNQGSEDISRFELHNGCNISITKAGAYTTEPTCKDYYNILDDQATVPYTQAVNNQFKISATSEGSSGCLNLADYLSFLESVSVLPKIPNLRLLIEWNLLAADFYQDPDAQAITKRYENMRPTLVVEELINMPENTGPVKIPYLQTIAERFVVPQVVAGVTSAQSFRSNAFVGRYLKDLKFFNKTTFSDGWMTAKQRSPAMYREKLQLVVNGSKYLPDTGIDQEAQKIQYFNEAFGPLNLPQFAYLPDLVDASGRVHDAVTEPLQNNFTVTGVSVEAPIERLDIEYQRTGRGSGDQVDQFDLVVFGRVARLMELVGGKVRLSY